jgi:hypothetical protein
MQKMILEVSFGELEHHPAILNPILDLLDRHHTKLVHCPAHPTDDVITAPASGIW